MSVAYCNLKGEKIGKLTPIELVDDFESNKTTKKWKCQCECGNFINFSSRVLNEAKKLNKNISCGCSRKNDLINTIHGDYLVIRYNKEIKNNKFRFFYCKCIKCGDEVILSTAQLYKHKMCQSCHKKEAKTIKKLKQKLSSIKRRCYDEKDKAYVNYGARGIRVCEEWLGNSDKFVEWALSNGYREDLTIDRIDNNGNYCPENCRWVDVYVQANNKRNNLNIEYNGKIQTLKQWCRELNLPYRQTHSRIYEKDWSVERAFSYKKKE